MKENIQSLTFEKLQEVLLSLGEKKYRAEQIFYELHNGKTLEQMSNIPKQLVQKLQALYDDDLIKIIKVQTSSDGTQKFLYQLLDGNIIEGVLMSYKFGYTLCVSTQVGCRMGCKFCASGLDGLIRNLSSGEIISQIIKVNNYLGGNVKDRKVANIVLMGSGEPLDNFENVCDFIDIANDKHGLNYSERNISISTCGLVDKIYKLADLKKQVNLCISLHAPNNQIRKRIMPVANSATIEQLLDACKYFADKTNRRILFEYIMIDNVNSSHEDALQLAKKLSPLNCIVNLINLNEVKENDFKSCSKETIDNFARVLKDYNINVTTRRSLGKDIDGACGQLRRKFIKQNVEQ